MDRLIRLEAALAAQQCQIDQLRSENATLRREAAPLDAPPSPSPAALGRRSLLTKGLASAGAATAGAVLMGVEPAAAANGQALVIGGNNFGTAATRLNVAAPGTDGGVQIIDSGGLPDLGGARPALVLSATGNPLSEAMRVVSSHSGIIVDASGVGVGVQASASGGTAVAATASGNTPGIAVRATSASSTGVDVLGATYGVVAQALGTGSTGVQGFGQRIGVRGSAPASTGDTNIGVLGEGPTGVKGLATIANGIAVLAENALGTAVRTTGRAGIDVDAEQWHLRLTNGHTRNDPNGDTIAHQRGDIVETSAGELWLCTTAGTPGTWRKLAGPNTAGAFHVLPAPARVYDSRPGTSPTAVGPKTPFAANTTRTFDLKVNGSLVPAGATAAMVTLLLVNAASANGNLTIWANGVAKPVANTLVWGGSAGRFTATAVTALDAQARVQVNASARTDLVIDVVGFYR